MALVPVANFASNAASWILILGMFAGVALFKSLLPWVIAAFGAVTLFHLVTLPVEYDASRRAKEQLMRLGIISGEERRAVNRVLGSAALTYVAAMVSSLFQLLYFVMLARGDDRD
jgi:hypothetical protein